MYVNRSTDISSFSNCLLCKTAYIVLNEKNHLDKILVLIENVKYTAIQYVLYIFFLIFHHITSFCDILMKWSVQHMKKSNEMFEINWDIFYWV